MNAPSDSFGLWATGTGALTRLSPSARLVVGSGWLLAATVSDLATPAGAAIGLGSVGLALLAAKPRARPLARRALLGVTLLAPVFLLAPWSGADLPDRVLPGVASVITPWRIFTTGMAVLVISLATVSTLSRSDLREALARLPLPRLFGAVALMVALQTEAQLREVQRIMLALRARGSPRSWRRRLGVVSGIPGSWLPRLYARADRIGWAMQVRGYDGSPLSLEEPRAHPWDWPAVALAIGWLGLGLLVRLEALP